MCGIAGILGPEPERKLRMDRMLAAQAHRGPDASASFDLGACGILGHNRLSVIDLAPASNQPFQSADGRYVLVYNGEIYNYLELKAELLPDYPFRTQSDTEVLLAAYIRWGEDCLERLIGMFSFAVWDSWEKKLFAARDRFGVKPFYYVQEKGQFLFASEIKTLWAAGVSRRPNEAVWANYFTHGTYGKPEETFWTGIRQLPGGHSLRWSDGRVEIKRWYDFVQNIQAFEQTADQTSLMERWRDLAEESISLRFRSDVPVGFNLSGGLDSSLLLGLVHREKGDAADIRTFTFYTGDTRYDELPWAREMMKRTAFRHIPVLLDASEVPELAAYAARAQDEPFGGMPTLAYDNIFAQARALGVPVLLDGQGLDEAWAGYDYYLSNANTLVQGTGVSSLQPNCLHPEFAALAGPLAFERPFDNDLQNVQYRDTFFTKLPRALRFSDRVSMRHGIELREPFLDHRLFELAFALPYSMKIHQGQQKWLLRQIAADLIPAPLSLAPKRPLQTPQREWLADALRPWVEAQLEALCDHCPEWFQPDLVRASFARFLREPVDNSFYVWQWINTSLLFS